MTPKIKQTNDKIAIAILKSKREKILAKGELTKLDELELERIEAKLERLENGNS